MAWIRTIPDDEAKGRLAQIYKAAIQRAGRVYGIVRLMSLQPDMLQASMGFYLASTTSPDSPLPRWFRELIAVWVSRLNDCFY
jgi:alkylhydroperoxidase family enzyme